MPGPDPKNTLPGPIRDVLEIARWAPSGDNTQPWRFEPIDERRVRVHGFDTRSHCVYDLDGRPSRLSIGAMLETLRIAAASFGTRAVVCRERSAPEEKPVFDVELSPDPHARPHPLADFVQTRSVQRKPLSVRPLSAHEKQALESAVGPRYEVRWFEGWPARREMAALMFRSARIRLTIEEAYRVHASIIEWNARHSVDRVPDAALGADPMSLRAMRWAMGSWERTRFVSRYLGGTIPPRIQLDLLPALLCAAHLVLLDRSAPAASDRQAALDADFDAGAAVQRFWLTAEKLNLRHQPEITPLVFSRYAATGVRFTTDEHALAAARSLRASFGALLGADTWTKAVWIGRIGAGERARARSLRLPLDRLIHDAAGGTGH